MSIDLERNKLEQRRGVIKGGLAIVASAILLAEERNIAAAASIIPSVDTALSPATSVYNPSRHLTRRSYLKAVLTQEEEVHEDNTALKNEGNSRQTLPTASPSPVAEPAQTSPAVTLAYEITDRWSDLKPVGDTRVSELSPYELPKFHQKGYYDGSAYITEKEQGVHWGLRRTPELFDDFKLHVKGRLLNPAQPGPGAYFFVIFGKNPENDKAQGMYLVHPDGGPDGHGDIFFIYQTNENDWSGWQPGFTTQLDKSAKGAIRGFVYRGPDTIHELGVLRRDRKFYTYYNGYLISRGWHQTSREFYDVAGLSMDPLGPGQVGVGVVGGKGDSDSIAMKAAFYDFSVEGDVVKTIPKMLS